MGCDIYSFVEVRRDGQWQHATGDLLSELDEWSRRDEPFPVRSYDLFGFLADVRNDAQSPVISPPRGLPDDVSASIRDKHGGDSHFLSASWLTIAELLAYDYDTRLVDPDRDETTVAPPRRFPGASSVRELLGEWYFERLDELSKLGPPEDVRVVFYFDG